MSKDKKITNTPVSGSAAKIRDFCSKRKMIIIITVCVLAATILGVIIRGVNIAIEFKGGTLITYTYSGDIDLGKAEETVKSVVDTSVTVRSGERLDSDDKELTISFTSNSGLTADRQTELSAALLEAFPDNNLTLFDSNDVNPSTGTEFFLKCVVAVLFAAVIIIIYIAV